MLTTQFFAMKIQRYMAEHGISESTLAKVAAKAFDNGARNPNAWRRKPLSEDEVLGSQDGQPPADAVHVLLAGRGRGRARAGARRARPGARAHAGVAAVGRVPHAPVRLLRGVQPVDPDRRRRRRRRPRRPRPRSSRRASAPSDVDVAQLQDTESGAEIMHLAETGLCEHGEQEALIQSGATEIGGRLPVNTDGGCLANGEPIGASGLRQVHEVVLQLRGEAGEPPDRRARRASASRRSTARRGSARARCSAAERSRSPAGLVSGRRAATDALPRSSRLRSERRIRERCWCATPGRPWTPV